MGEFKIKGLNRQIKREKRESKRVFSRVGIVIATAGVWFLTGCGWKIPENSVCKIGEDQYAPLYVCCKNSLSSVGKSLSTQVDKESVADSFAVSELWFKIKAETKLFLDWNKITPPQPEEQFWKELKEFVIGHAKKLGAWENGGKYYSFFHLSKKELKKFFQEKLKLDPKDPRWHSFEEIF